MSDFEDKRERPPWIAPDPMIVVPSLEPASVQVLNEIAEFKGQFARLAELSPDSLKELKRVATIESIGASTRIEGAELSDHEVEQVLEGISLNPFRSRDESEVRGYGELLTTIFDSYDQIELTENHLKQLHQILLRHSEKDTRHRGEYKTVGNDVGEVYSDGRPTRILFRTAPPFNTRIWMPRLLEETRAALDDARTPKLVVVANFVLWFLAIHPFKDGNGRLSRAVTTLLMLKLGYAYVPYASMEKVIEDNKADYYRYLRAAQLRAPEQPGDYRDWLDFFLGAVRAQQQNLEARMSAIRSASRLPPLDQKIFGLLEIHGALSSSQLSQRLDTPGRTVRYHLKRMVQQGLINDAGGERKNRVYVLESRAVQGRATAGAEDGLQI